jgi:hypothetical protein
MLALAGVVWAAPSRQADNLRNFVINSRANLELLANQVFGEGQRPQTWTFNVNNTGSPTFVSDMWFDSEQLADQLFSKQRPAGWIGAPTTKNVVIAARNIRHDLELSADQLYGQDNRPTEWRADRPLYRCDRSLLNLVELLSSAYTVNFQTPDTAVNFCATLAAEAENQVLRLAFAGPDVETQADDLILAVRGDLERLADERLGLNTRPPGWTGNRVKESPTLATDILQDLESLADNLLAGQPRPPGWIGGPLPNTKVLIVRNLRHDLELLANAVGQIPRPRGWQGNDPQATCEPLIQNLAIMAQKSYNFSTQSVPTGGNFCAQLALAANQLVENPPQPDVTEATESPEESKFAGESRYAFTYLDSAATQFMGIMPLGTKFKAWYRNFGESSMMFVSGEKFAVFIDRRWTTLAPEAFVRLPTTEGVKPLTFCDAQWCNGPGPTPTPTGSGAIAALINQGTPPAAPDVEQISGEKKQVSWNNIRVTYLLDNAAARTVQVTLQICTDTSQTECEGVVAIFDKKAGAPKPVLSQSNGLNVYEFPYGYSTDLVIEGKTLFSPDVWISDPTIR